MKKNLKLFIKIFILTMVCLLSYPINVEAATPKINKKFATLEVDAFLPLTIKNSSGTIKWTTSNKAVAKVSKKGNVLAIKEGVATITGTVNEKSTHVM